MIKLEHTEVMGWEHVIRGMRREDKLDEWHEFCRWIEELPYSEIMIGDKT